MRQREARACQQCVCAPKSPPSINRTVPTKGHEFVHAQYAPVAHDVVYGLLCCGIVRDPNFYQPYPSSGSHRSTVHRTPGHMFPPNREHVCTVHGP